jgi:hypothetical protein
MSENNGRPKVEIALNQEARLKLLRDKAFTGQNSYGNYYLYSVSQDGVEKSFFATDDIHKRILEEGLRTGDTFLVRKKAIQSGKKILTKIDFEVVDKTPFSVPQNGNGHTDNLKDILLECVKDADYVLKNAESQISDECQKLATALFIARTRMS